MDGGSTATEAEASRPTPCQVEDDIPEKRLCRGVEVKRMAGCGLECCWRGLTRSLTDPFTSGIPCSPLPCTSPVYTRHVRCIHSIASVS